MSLKVYEIIITIEEQFEVPDPQSCDDSDR